MPFLESRLNDAHGKHINIDRDRPGFTRHYNVLRDTIYKGLKAVAPFDKWLNGHKLGGSYGDNLKITMPDEFDLVIHLKFPENERITVKKDPCRPGNVILNMTEVLKILKNQDHNRVTYTHLIKLVSSKNELMEHKLQALITSAMTKVLNGMEYKINVDGNITEVTYRRCGPAHTMFIDTKDIKYSVDFVPAIKLNASQNILGEEELKYFVKNGFWEAIPKPLKPIDPNNVSFRASYYDSELLMLKDKHKLKEVIRFMKKFRDNKQNMSNLKSYFIKTVLLWQVKEKPSDYWRTFQLKDVLIQMLRKLNTSLATSGRYGKLPFFWDPKLDLFATLTDTQRYDMFNCITGVIYTLERADGNLTNDIDNCIKLIFNTPAEKPILIVRPSSSVEQEQEQRQQEQEQRQQEQEQRQQQQRQQQQRQQQQQQQRQQQQQEQENEGASLAQIGIAAVAIGALAIGAFSYFRSTRSRTD